MPNLWMRHKRVGILTDRALCTERKMPRLRFRWADVTCSHCIALGVAAHTIPQEGN